MSLISVENFMAPLRSKAKVAGLIVAAIVVIVLRFVSSRSDEVRDMSSGHITDAEARRAVQMQVKDFLDAQEDIAPRNRAPAAREPDSSLESLLGQRPDPEETQAPDPSGANSPKSFSDIRKSLGLE